MMHVADSGNLTCMVSGPISFPGASTYQRSPGTVGGEGLYTTLHSFLHEEGGDAGGGTAQPVRR